MKPNPLPTNRIPRPIGSTLMAQRYHNATKPEEIRRHKRRLLEHYIDHYVLQGYSILGYEYNIQEFSYMLGIRMERLVRLMANRVKALSGMNGSQKAIEKSLQLVTTMALSGALESRAIVRRQYGLLADSQGDGYKAFVSSEVNKAVQSLLKHDQNMVQLMTALRPASQVTINTQVNQSQIHENTENKYLTVEQALALQVPEKGGFGPETLKALEGSLPEGLPEVVALRQEGVHDNSDIGALAMAGLGDMGLKGRKPHEPSEVRTIELDTE
jgi:hypothetical protein